MKNAPYKMTVTEQNLYGHKFITYGIQGANIRFDDISDNMKKVEEMIYRINTEYLEESQLMYFIEDELI